MWCVWCVVWSGLVWSGLVWSGLVWSGLVWSGLVWSGLCCAVLCCAVLCCAVLCCAVLCCTVLCVVSCRVVSVVVLLGLSSLCCWLCVCCVVKKERHLTSMTVPRRKKTISVSVQKLSRRGFISNAVLIIPNKHFITESEGKNGISLAQVVVLLIHRCLGLASLLSISHVHCVHISIPQIGRQWNHFHLPTGLDLRQLEQSLFPCMCWCLLVAFLLLSPCIFGCMSVLLPSL